MSTPTENQLTAFGLVSHYEKNKLYGRIELIFKGGDLVFIKKEETIVPHAAEYVREEMQSLRRS